MSHAISDDRRRIGAFMVEAWVAVDSWRRLGTRRGVSRVRLDTRRRASFDRLKCREFATYLRGRQPARPLDGRSSRSSAPGCEPKAAAAHDIQAACKRDRKKTFCRVTTRGRKHWTGRWLGRGLGPLAARPLRGGVLRLHLGRLAALRLPPASLPATKKTSALRVLAVALVPTLRLVPPTATLAKANARARLPPAGLRTCYGSRLSGAHGSCRLPRVSPRKRLNSSSGTLVKGKETKLLQSSRSGEGDREGRRL